MTVTLEEKAGELYLPIPPDVAAVAGLKPGVEVMLRAVDGTVTAEKFPLRKIALKELLDQITPEQLHGEVAWGPQVGREVW